jgi:hypothetical protein
VALKPVEVLRKLDRLLTLDVTLRDAVQRLSGDIATLNERVTRLEAREAVMVAEAKGAAAAAASMAASATIADLARRIGVLEERSRSIRLLPPNQTEDR